MLLRGKSQGGMGCWRGQGKRRGVRKLGISSGNYYLERKSSLIVDKNSFLIRLIRQILGIFNQRFTERLRTAYHTDPLEFLGLFLVMIPPILIILTIALFIICAFFFINSSITKMFSNYLIGILGILAVFFFIGSMIFSQKHREDKPELTENTSTNELNKDIKIKNKSIFIVHGHDTEKKDEVVRFLRELQLCPVILQDEPSRGKTIIEKVEFYISQTSFAIVLLTRDDFGLSKEDSNVDEIKNLVNQSNYDSLNHGGSISNIEKSQVFLLVASTLRMLKAITPRSRQNVIFELGLTIGHLHRDNVCVLYEDGVELPTDIHGLSYVSLKGQWRENLLKELIAAGIECKIK